MEHRRQAVAQSTVTLTTAASSAFGRRAAPPVPVASAGTSFLCQSVVSRPDILASSAFPPMRDSDPGGLPATVPHFPGVYHRGPVPPNTQEQHLTPAMLPALYPSAGGSSLHLAARHPALPLPGHTARPTSELGPPGYHILTTEVGIGVSSGARCASESLPDIVHSHSAGHLISPRPNHHRPAGGAGRHQRSRQHQARQHGRTHSRRDTASSQQQQQQQRRGRTQSATSTTTTTTADGGRCKEPCVKCLLTLTSFRWVLVVLSLLGVLCVVTGIVLAALHAAGSSFLFLAIMFIGLGVLLVIVVAVGWKCTPRGHEPLHALLSIGEFSNGGRRERRRPRIHRQRDGNWYGGMLYPEFQYPRPPPSYAASMQEYSSQLALVQSSNNNNVGNNNNNNNNTNSSSNNNNNSIPNTTAENYSLPGSPPPSYRSRASTIHSGVHITFPPGTDSMPPTYRSRASTHRRPRLSFDDTGGNGGADVADVSFSEPVITAESVQQVIGTGRYQQRHGPIDDRNPSRHTRSASLDLAQTPDTTHHRRGASDHLTNILSLSSQEQSHSSQLGAQAVTVRAQAGYSSDLNQELTLSKSMLESAEVEEVLRDLNERIARSQGNETDEYNTAL